MTHCSQTRTHALTMTQPNDTLPAATAAQQPLANDSRLQTGWSVLLPQPRKIPLWLLQCAHSALRVSQLLQALFIIVVQLVLCQLNGHTTVNGFDFS